MNNEPLVMSVDEWAQDTDGRQRNCNPAKASCSLQRGIATLRKLPAACSGKSQRAKASCSLQREIATCESFL